MQSIPASQLVNVIPSVLGAGGNELSLNAVFLTEDTSPPIGTVLAFTTLAGVQAWFGANSAEAILAGIYFSGFTGATALPGALYFYQYNASAVAGYLRGGPLTGVTLAQIQALSGTLTVVIDGVSHVSGAINLSSATSFSNAAALIQTALQGGTPSTTATVTYDSLRNAFVITSGTTGSTSAVGFATANSLTSGLNLTAVTGAIQSAGATAATPAGAMNGVVAATQNWATFMTVFDPDSGTLPPTNKLAFANWASTQSPAGAERFAYVAWDVDSGPANSNSDASSFGALVTAAQYNGVVPVWEAPTLTGQQPGSKAAFICGIAASTDFTATNGRVTYAGRNQAGLVADVTNATVAANLEANGYNFYGAYATANQLFLQLQNGSMPGAWKWIDPYINQIWLNSAFQLALMELLANTKSIPYNAQGFALIRAACMDPVNAALNAGVIRGGVSLSAAQAQEVNTAAGVTISDVLQNIGWYLQIKDPGAIIRGERGSPSNSFWYTDGGSIQKINLSSVDIE